MPEVRLSHAHEGVGPNRAHRGSHLTRNTFKDASMVLGSSGGRKLMKLVPLSRGMFSMVDDEDYDHVMAKTWHVEFCGGKAYASHTLPRDKNGKKSSIRMHRFITSAPKGMDVDHRDRNTLNNTRENLRVCTHSKNEMNRPLQKNNTSGCKGVDFIKSANLWRARIPGAGKHGQIGYFKDFESAKSARLKAEIELFGEFSVPHVRNPPILQGAL